MNTNMNFASLKDKQGTSLHLQMNTSITLILISISDSWFKEGVFSIKVQGPSEVIMKRIGMSYSRDKTRTLFLSYLLQDNITPNVKSNYSVVLKNNSRQHGHLACDSLDYYYEALEIKIKRTDYYSFISNADFQTSTYLYEHYFNPHKIYENLLFVHEYKCTKKRFQMTAYLHYNITYILIVTSAINIKNVRGRVSVIANGPDKIKMKLIGNY